MNDINLCEKKKRKTYDKHGRDMIECKSCNKELPSENYRIYYYQAVKSGIKEKRRVATCNACVNLRRIIASGKKRLENINKNEKIGDKGYKISDWINDTLEKDLIYDDTEL